VNTETVKPLRVVHLLASMLLFCLLFFISYPYYRYYIDPDAVAYLTMAKRAAAGEPMRLVNALWSPLHPAMVAVCIRSGMNALLAAQLTNGLACLLIIAGTYTLFRRYKISQVIGLPLLLSLSVFLTYALYKQLFCDLWQVALLLFYLLLVTAEKFTRRPLLWLLCALVMALAAYAKIYSFYFLLLHLPLSLWGKARGEKTRFPFKAYIVTFALQFLLLLPLAGLMHKKYGFWDFSKSGALNTSWTLAGHKSLRPEIHGLIPPPYVNSPYTWEDPYVAEGILHSRFESIGMMKSQAAHSAQATLQGIEAANQLSSFLLIALLASVFAAFFRGDSSFSSGQKMLLAAAIIMPLGYLLLHFEARYIWLLLPIGMLFGAMWLERLRHYLNNRAALLLGSWIFALSFVAYPLYDLKALFRGGEKIYLLATDLASHNVLGSFASNDNPSRAGVLAYWLGCNYFAPAKEVVTREELLADMRRYHVNFYFHHQNGLDAAEAVMVDEQGQPLQRLDANRIKGMQIFLVNP
jgi:hypothetical protein